ncbi:MAG TPA: hypothetical protein VGI10_16520 [Polyangiaceae bacterium]
MDFPAISRSVGSAGLLCLAIASGCGKTAQPDTGATISPTTGGTSAMAGAGGGLVLGGAGGSSATGGSAGGNSAASGSSGAGGAGGTRTSECAPGSTHLTGSWDGVAWQGAFSSIVESTSLTASNASWLFYSPFLSSSSNDGFVGLYGQGSMPMRDGVPHSAHAVLLMPSTGPDGGTWFCSSNATVTEDAVDTRVDVEGLGALGSCANGTPVSGTITVCESDSFAKGCDLSRSGTLDGNTLSNIDAYAGTSDAYLTLPYVDGMVLTYARENQFLDATGPLTNAFVVLADGTIYCAGASSMFVETEETTTQTNRWTDTLTDFRKMGSCAAVTGANSAVGCLSAE